VARKTVKSLLFLSCAGFMLAWLSWVSWQLKKQLGGCFLPANAQQDVGLGAYLKGTD